jgi:hypothetical protein
MRICGIATAVMALLFCGAARAQTSAASLSTEQLGVTCDRACLIDTMDQYLAALIAHNPAQVALATHVKFSENGVVLPVGSASWQTATGMGSFKQYVVDPQDHSVAFVGTIMEHNAEAILSVRLKLQDRVIQEIEQIMVRNPQGAAAWDSRAPSGIRATTTVGWNDALTPAQRSPRDRMTAIANT